MMRSGKSRVVKQVYVVDISGPSGGRVAKEYEARSLLSAVRRAERELRAFPECQVNRHTVETGLGHMCRS